MNIGNRFPKLRINPETFEKHKSTLLLTGAASVVGSGALFLIEALGFVGEAENVTNVLNVIEEGTDTE